MKIYAIGAQKPLIEHLDHIQNSRNASTWRCFITKLDKGLYQDPYAQKIVLNFIEENYRDFDVYEFAFYWLKTGHVFLLFQGRMKKAHETFEKFLDFVSENVLKISFQTYDMGRQFDWVQDVLDEALKDIEVRKNPEKKKKLGPVEKCKRREEERRIETLRKERDLRVKPLLLLVEDERMTQVFISSLLENYCEIVLAETIVEGRELYKELWPSLVFMDIMLPDGDGQDLVEEFMKLDLDAYIIMVSGYISDEKISRCQRAGAKGFVAKPVTQDKERLMQQIFDYNQYKRTG